MAEKEIFFNLLLSNMPKDIRDFILDEQTAIKKDKNIQFSMEATIYKLLYTHPKFKSNGK